MAKNLKLTIKNNQLAEALKLNQLKKPIRKKAAEPAPIEEPIEAASPLPVEEVKVEEVKEVKAAPPPPTPPTSVEKMEADTFEDKEEPARPEPRREAPPARPAPSGYRPPYQPRPAYQPPRPGQQPYRPGGQQPYTPRPSYPQGAGAPGASSYPPRPPRPPMRPGEIKRHGAAPAPTPRPYQPRPAGPSSAPPAKRPPRPGEFKPATEEAKPARKPAPGFKEFRDIKPYRKSERTFDSRDKQGLRDLSDEQWRKRRPSKKMAMQEEVTIRPKALKVRLPITVKDLASEMKLKASQLIAKLLMSGVVVTLNDNLDDETTVQLLGQEFDCEITIDTSEQERIRITDKTIRQEIQDSDAEQLILRPPVVTFMGHVDHGKTSLIDSIRKTNLAASEAGAITQHIGAFKCHTAVGDLTILDTPGHEAFSAMRARGAEVTDIVVLVIAGDEGIRTQTLEAIQQAKDAKVPIVVAINKSDKPNFNAETIYRGLADIELLPEAWGGTTITVNCSATSGQGIKELLEMLALQAELLELKANPKSRARGTVIESEMHKGMGHVATILVQNGTLRLGDSVVFGQNWATIKTMQDESGRSVREAGPSTPVKITGLSGLPEAGNEFIVVKNEKEARELSEKRSEGQKRTLLMQAKRGPLESFLADKANAQEKKVLNLILRADVQGSLEALKNALNQIASKKVEINIISSDVGEISESDVQLAAASKAVILGFHTKMESHAESLVKQLKVIVKSHDIIYHAVDDVRAQMLALLDKIPKENDVGEAVVKAIFKSSQVGAIAGCMVTDGNIKRSNHVRVVRDGHVLWKGPISSLKRVKEDVREVSKGFECGILLQGFTDLKEGDILQAFEITYLQQEL